MGVEKKEDEEGVQSLSLWESVAELWVREGGLKNKWGRVLHDEHNDKQKNFSVICGRFPLTPPNSVWRLDPEPLKGQDVFLFLMLWLKKRNTQLNTFKLSWAV